MTSQRMAVDDWRAMIDKTEAQSNAEPPLRHVVERCRTILANMALENDGSFFMPRWPIHHEPLRNDAKNLLPLIDASLAQSDAEPVADEDAVDAAFGKWAESRGYGRMGNRLSFHAGVSFGLRHTAPPRPDASAELIEAADATAIECAIGGKYEMPDGRSFWIDAPVAREMTRRVINTLRARAADRRWND